MQNPFAIGYNATWLDSLCAGAPLNIAAGTHMTVNRDTWIFTIIYSIDILDTDSNMYNIGA